MGFTKEIKIGIVTLFLLGCGSSNKMSQVTEAEKQALEELVASNNLEIRANWARPLATSSLNSIANAGLLPVGDTASRINLMGNPGFLRIKGDVVSAYLPYFGERQIGGGYNTSNNAVQFDGKPKNLEWRKDPKTQGYLLDFSIDNGTETYTIAARISPRMKSSINVNSSHRLAIAYSGSAMDNTENVE